MKKSANGRRIATPLEAFEARVVRHQSGCWGWNGSTIEAGYGTVRLGGRGGQATLAHRLSWTLHCGEIPDEMQVLHTCDNPPCTRPGHLFLGTNLDNIRDRVAKGRSARPNLGKPSPMRRLQPGAIREIRERFATGESRTDIAADFDTSASYVWRIACRGAGAKECV